MRVDYTKMTELLRDYEDGDMGEGFTELKDELLDLNECLTREEGIDEGNKYELALIAVEPGGELPKLYEKFEVPGLMGSGKSTLYVQEITEIKWNKAGRLVVEVLAGRK